MQHLHPVSSNELKCSILLFSLLSFSFKGKEGSLAHKFAGGKGEDNGVDRAIQEKFRLAGKQTTEKLSCQSLSNQF